MSVARARLQFWNWPDAVRRYHSFVTLVVAGLIAVGVSGIACDVLSHLYGQNIIAGDSQSAHLSSTRCANLLSWFPRAPDCSHAELAHHTDEVVTYREIMLPAGVLLAASYWLARRKWFAGDAEVAGVRRLRLSMGATAFGLAAIALFGYARVEHSNAGLGRNLSDGGIATIAALAYGVLAWRRRAAG